MGRRRPARATDRWGDSGQLFTPLDALVLAGVMLVTGLGLGGMINYASSDSLPGPGKPDPIRPAALATFAAAPDNDCAKRVLADFPGTVRFENGTWEAPDTPKPKLPFQPDEKEIIQYNNEVKAWNALMKDRVGVVLKELDNHDCNKTSPPIASSTSESSESSQTSNIGGTYDVQWSNGGGPCVAEYSADIIVSGGGSTVTLKRADDQASITADLQSDQSFSFNGQDSKGNLVLASGRFSAGTGGDVILRGSWETTFSSGAQKSCSYDVFGKRR